MKLKTHLMFVLWLCFALAISQTPAQSVSIASPLNDQIGPLLEVTDLNIHALVSKSATPTVIVISGDQDSQSVRENSVLVALQHSYAGRVNFVHAVLKQGDNGFFAPEPIKNIISAAHVRYVPTLLYVSSQCKTVTVSREYSSAREVAEFIDVSQADCADVTPESRNDDPTQDSPKKFIKLNAAQFLRDADQSEFGIGIAVRMKDAGKVFDTLPKENVTKEQFNALLKTLDAQRLGSQFPLMIDTVYPGSAAALAKLQKGDLITAVNGKSLDGLTLDAGANILFDSSKNKVVLSVSRGTEKFTVSLTPTQFLTSL